jgi:peptidyl-tRNA hydrolase, PTH1 family
MRFQSFPLVFVFSLMLIVGLGNPGAQYERTRHNVGFMLIDLLASETGAQVKRKDCRSLIGRAELEGQRVDLVKPQTFMNLSGEAVSCLLAKQTDSKSAVSDLLVISDDLALPFGTIRLRRRGSAGGHNGLKSIIAATGTDEFIRLRIGIQPEHPLGDTRKFVLDEFSRDERAGLEKILERSAEALRAVIRDGIDKAMAQYNGDSNK